MKRQKSIFPSFFILIMLFCVLFIAWYLPAVSALRFRISDQQISLETSQGRERKQQHEYDEAVSALAEAKDELERISPQADEAADTKKVLKEERKSLRAELKELEQKQTGEDVKDE